MSTILEILKMSTKKRFLWRSDVFGSLQKVFRSGSNKKNKPWSLRKSCCINCSIRSEKTPLTQSSRGNLKSPLSPLKTAGGKSSLNPARSSRLVIAPFYFKLTWKGVYKVDNIMVEKGNTYSRPEAIDILSTLVSISEGIMIRWSANRKSFSPFILLGT